MRNKIKQHTLIGIVAGLWLLGLISSILWCVLSGKGNGPDIIITAVSALFSGIALIIAYWGIYRQSNDLNRQIDVDIFTRTIGGIIDSQKFYESRVYIFSNDYNRDIEKIKRILGKEDISLNDIKNLCYKRGQKHIKIKPQEKEELRKSYEKILHFCSKLEYLGVIYESEVADEIIIDYYGATITESYQILESLITSANNKHISLYPHYTHLYNRARVREELFQQIVQTLLKKTIEK